MSRSKAPAYNITSAQRGISIEQKNRRNRYMIGMSIRTMCFIGAILATGTLRWVLIAGAILLPYIAVFIANAGREWDRAAFRSPVKPRDKSISVD